MLISLSSGFTIDTIHEGDASRYVDLLQDKEIYDFTLAIPYPYKLSDAQWYIRHVEEQTLARAGVAVNFCIRDVKGLLVGGCGFHDFEPGKSHKAELGYWIGKPYWGRGIMSEAVKALVEYGFSKLGLQRITATIFAHNAGSARVLEKAKFQKEGVLRSYYQKDGKIFDGILFARILAN